MRIGLSLSGGGYRAAAYHLGTLRKLNQMKILNSVGTLCTVSGGSIIGAYYCLFDGEFKKFEGEFTSLLKKSVIKKIFSTFIFIRLVIFIAASLTAITYFLFFSSFNWLGLLLIITLIFILIKYQFRIFPVSKVIEKIYDDLFFNKSTLKEFNKAKPKIVICSTNLQTGRQFYFTSDKMSDSSYDDTYSNQSKVRFNQKDFPVSRAVMCSSCVPFAFSPVRIEKEFIISTEGFEKLNPLLIDGGIYDNQGIHKLTHPNGEYECDIIITSDAGDKLPFQGSYNNLVTLLLRTSELFMNRIKLFQMMQNLYYNQYNPDREIAYISLGWDLKNCISGFVRNLRDGNITEKLIDAHGLKTLLDPFDELAIIEKLKKNTDYERIISEELSDNNLKIARAVSTNLTALTDDQINFLSKHAELLTELQVKLYCPSLIHSKIGEENISEYQKLEEMQ